MNCSCLTLAFFLTPMPQNVSSMEPTSVLRELMLTPRTSSHHSKSPLQSILLTSSPTRFHCRTTRNTGNGVRNAPPPPYLVCTLVIGRLQLKVISSPSSTLSSLTYSPVRWQQGLSVMLEKKKGVCIPSKATLCHPTNGSRLQLPQQAILWPMHAAMGRIPEPDPTGNWWQPKWSPSNQLCH